MGRLLQRLISFGIAADLPIDQRIALRTSNVVAILLATLSPFFLAGWLVDARIVNLGVITGGFFFLYVVALLLNGVRLYDFGRFLLFGASGLHLAITIMAMGTRAGFEYYLAAVVLFPLLCFAKSERQKIAIAYGLYVVPIAVAFLWLAARTPIVEVPDAARMHAYWFNLFFVTVIFAGTLLYYHLLSLNARIDLDAEKRRTEEILANVVPAWIAARLKSGERTIADAHGEATILFADLVEFSKLATRLAPSHLVEILNTVFSRFDELAERHGIEKIKTIGDCYMAAGGVLAEGGSRTPAVADLALDMLKVVDEIGSDIGYPLQLRIGISTGPVISGVLGRNKFQFDVWGDTVNLASRMQEYSEAGRIQVSEATYWRLHNQYEFESRGAIDVKGHDHVPTYFLIGHKSPAAHSGHAA